MLARTLKRIAAGCAAVLLVSVCASAVRVQTGSVSGKVVREGDGGPIYDAIVTAEGTGKTTHTDRGGKYKFDALEKGKDYTLVMIKSPLYKDGTITVNVKSESNEAEIVRLVRKSANELNLGAMIGLLDAGKYEEFEKRLSVLSKACEGLDDKDCKLIREADGLFDKNKPQNNMDKLREKLDKLSGFGEGQISRPSSEP